MLIECLGASSFPSLSLWIIAMKYSALAAVIACLLVSLLDALLLRDICCIVIAPLLVPRQSFFLACSHLGNPSKGFGPVSKEDALQFLEIFGGRPASTIIWFPMDESTYCFRLLCLSLVPFSLVGVGMLNAGCAYHGVSSMAVDDPCLNTLNNFVHPFRITNVFSVSKTLKFAPAPCRLPITREWMCLAIWDLCAYSLSQLARKNPNLGTQKFIFIWVHKSVEFETRVQHFDSNRCDSGPFNPVGFLLRQGGWCLVPQHGWQCHAAPGYSCVLVLIAFHNDWRTAKVIKWAWWFLHSDITEVQGFHTQVILEGRRRHVFLNHSQRLTSCHISKCFLFGSCYLQISQPQLQETLHTQVWIWETGFAGECATCLLAVATPKQLLVVCLHCCLNPDVYNHQPWSF